MKFKVKDEKHSEQIQEALFKLGYKWHASENKVMLRDEPYLFADHDDMSITYCSSESYFNEHKNTEYELHHDIIQRVLQPYTQEISPIGLRPKSVVDNLRVHEILEAMQRYTQE